MSPLLRKTLLDQRRPLIGWGAGLAGLAVMYAAFYPSIRSNGAALQNYVDRYLPLAFRTLIGGDLTSPAGYLRSETFSTLGPILFLVFAIGAGARAIAGEEEDRTLDLLLSTPVRRRQVLFDKWIAMAACALGLAAVLDLTNLVVGPLFQLRVSIADLSSICLMLFLLGLAFGTIALAVGCYAGRRATATGVTGRRGDVPVRAQRARSLRRRVGAAAPALALPLVPRTEPADQRGVGGQHLRVRGHHRGRLRGGMVLIRTTGPSSVTVDRRRRRDSNPGRSFHPLTA